MNRKIHMFMNFVVVILSFVLTSCGTIMMPNSARFPVNDGITGVWFVDTGRNIQLDRAIKELQTDFFYSDMKLYFEESKPNVENIRLKLYNLYRKATKTVPTSDEQLLKYFSGRAHFVKLSASVVRSYSESVSLLVRGDTYLVTLDVTIYDIINLNPLELEKINSFRFKEEGYHEYNSLGSVFHSAEYERDKELVISLAYTDVLKQALKFYKGDYLGSYYKPRS